MSPRKINGGSAPRAILALALALLCCAAVTSNAAAGARHGARISGTYAVSQLGETTCAPLAAMRLRCVTSGLTSIYEGDLEGESSATFTNVIDCAHGRTYGSGVETFTGRLRGGPAGTLSWQIFFTADFDCGQFFPFGLRAIGWVDHSSGGLSGVSGVLRFDDTTYDGVLR